MTDRDEFAKAAMHAYIIKGVINSPSDYVYYSQMCYQLADAMINASKI